MVPHPPESHAGGAEILLGILAQRGYSRTVEPLDADVVLLNTCAIREHAEQKIFCRLGELRAQLRKSTAAASRCTCTCVCQHCPADAVMLQSKPGTAVLSGLE